MFEKVMQKERPSRRKFSNFEGFKKAFRIGFLANSG